MRLQAKLRRVSGIRRLWLQHNRVRGEVNGVPFAKQANGDYVTGELDPFQVAALQASPDVEVEMFSAPHPAAAHVVDAAEPPGVPAAASVADPEEPPVREAPQVPVMRQPPAPRPIPPSQWNGGRSGKRGR